jgi:hypothetical protein
VHTEGEISISTACCTDVVEDGVKSWFRHTRGIQCHLYPTRSPPGAITIRLMVLYPGPKVPSAPPFFCLCRNSFISLTDRKRNPKTELAIVLYGQNLRVGLQTVPADPEVLTIQNNGLRFRISFLFVSGQNLRVGLQSAPSRPGGSDHTKQWPIPFSDFFFVRHIACRPAYVVSMCNVQ